MKLGNNLDIYGSSTKELKNKKLFLFDMDGTIYEENNVFDGTHQLLDYINKINGKYVFITNNSSKSVDDYIKKLHKMDIKCDSENFFTSSQATSMYLKKYHGEKNIYCQGTKSFVMELKKNGIRVTEEVSDDIDVVVVGFDTELTSEKIRKTCEVLQKNVLYVATNPDLRCPVNFGFIPDCGAICHMIEDATNKKPIYIGKPEPVMVNSVREKLGYSVPETCVVGDRLYTDVATGLNAGVTAICVLTGEATVNEINNGSIKPTFTFNSVKDLYYALNK